MRKSANTAHKLAPIITFLLLLLLWEAGVRVYQIKPWILPGPLAVANALVKETPLLLTHTAATLLEALSGFFIAIVLALLLGIILNSSQLLHKAIYPLLIISQTIPLIVLAVLFTIWFGWGITPKIIIVVLVCFFPITINLMEGINSVDPDQINLFRSMGASNFTIFRMVKFPSALPAFFSGLRIAATYSIMAAVIGEWLGAQKGLGYFMTLKQKSFAIDEVLAAVIIICLLSFLLVKIVDLAEYFLLPWNRIEEIS
ncbi:ABC-type nitrate/sulfonate/bicarbonate transport system, permease component [Thermosyntropha lipolytica DSM 11003]|uniref:ABC-type nitrate/sulfonate/bicarbonate transport system, permease component n=1 Tax=Thermosyntropha lipolytica DSM 11003 TaxID=1123382 RepID=A0A1M5M2F9_9FIRM|nr:ABC transporter permease [Thermosyntropha lipolytica]SHG71441.1 ABC-type nitrate/sulfonate/bicarbonate transport system, permease component [Thermosyntropha lipolytica DSM 11003]